MQEKPISLSLLQRRTCTFPKRSTQKFTSTRKKQGSTPWSSRVSYEIHLNQKKSEQEQQPAAKATSPSLHQVGTPGLVVVQVLLELVVDRSGIVLLRGEKKDNKRVTRGQMMRIDVRETQADNNKRQEQNLRTDESGSSTSPDDAAAGD